MKKPKGENTEIQGLYAGLPNQIGSASPFSYPIPYFVVPSHCKTRTMSEAPRPFLGFPFCRSLPIVASKGQKNNEKEKREKEKETGSAPQPAPQV